MSKDVEVSLGAAEEAVLAVMRGEAEALDAARLVVAYQRRANPPLAAFWAGRGFVGAPSSLDEIPAVPTDVFRAVPLRSVIDPPVALFRTSGTTSGARGEHAVASLRAYDTGARIQWSRWVEPPVSSQAGTLAEPLVDRGRRWVGLVPDPALVPDSSLGHMVADLHGQFGRGAIRFHVKPDRFDVDEAVDDLSRREGPVVVVATAFALVELLDRLAARGVEAPQAAGSVLVETGGFKGRTREVEPTALRAEVAARLGIPLAQQVSEYSMTELSSQLYSPVGDTRPDRRLKAPPWCEVSAVDPFTLQRRAPGEVGLLRFVDLANVSTVIAVQTADLGVCYADGIELIGRAPGATPRGCSLAIEELLGSGRTG